MTLPKLFDLTGRVAFVTGGSKGLGLAMARGFAEAGADIVISSRNEAELRVALDKILDGTGRQGRYFVADVAQRAQAEQLARNALAAWTFSSTMRAPMPRKPSTKSPTIPGTG